jgi:hypothetical protein
VFGRSHATVKIFFRGCSYRQSFKSDFVLAPGRLEKTGCEGSGNLNFQGTQNVGVVNSRLMDLFFVLYKVGDQKKLSFF